MTLDGFTIRSVAEDASLENRIEDLVELVWPTFIRECGPRKGARYHGDYQGLYRRWPDFQRALLDERGDVVAALHCCPLAWDGDENDLPDDGWDWELETAADDLASGRAPRTLGAVSITIHPELRGRHMSAPVIGAMRAIGVDLGLKRLIAPVRPTQKAQHPFVSIEEYLTWKTPEGYSADAWIRTHERLGARVVKPCNQSMQLESNVANWRKWTGEAFATTGLHAFPGGLVPLQVDVEADQCLYIEPNVWMVHELSK